MSLEIKNGAVFVADSHYLPGRAVLSKFLEAFLAKTPPPSQLFLMGDSFDFLCSLIPESINVNTGPIKLINKIAEKSEVVLFEGNHDFLLGDIFPNIKVIPRSSQPLLIKQAGLTYSLAHGDLDQGFFYELYRNTLEIKPILKTLLFINSHSKSFITKSIYSHLRKKSLCKNIEDFEIKVTKILSNSKADVVIEGHYHQGKIIKQASKTYVGLPSLVCKKSFFVVEFNKSPISFICKNLKEF